MLGQSSTFTLNFFSKAVVVLEVRLGLLLLEYRPVAQVLKGKNHALLQYITVNVGIHGSLNKL